MQEQLEPGAGARPFRADVIPFRAGSAGSAVFTTADLAALRAWHCATDCRLAIEHGRPGREPECSAYALIYLGTQGWADWGLMRRGGMIAVWNCQTFADVGCFRSMQLALRALPGGADAPPAHVSATIIPMPRLLAPGGTPAVS